MGDFAKCFLFAALLLIAGTLCFIREDIQENTATHDRICEVIQCPTKTPTPTPPP